MTLEEIRQQVIDLVNEPGYTEYDIDSIINQVYQQVCSEVNIPSLFGVTTLSVTNTEYGVIDFLVNNNIVNVLKVRNLTTSKDVEIHPTLDALENVLIDRLGTGYVTDVTVQGNKIWYGRVPVEEAPNSLLISYYAVPAILIPETIPEGHPTIAAGTPTVGFEAGDNIPDAIPDMYQYKILVQGTALRIFDAIEQDEEETKVNTTVMFGAYSTGVQKLREWIGKNRVHRVYRHQMV